MDDITQSVSAPKEDLDSGNEEEIVNLRGRDSSPEFLDNDMSDKDSGNFKDLIKSAAEPEELTPSEPEIPGVGDPEIKVTGDSDIEEIITPAAAASIAEELETPKAPPPTAVNSSSVFSSTSKGDDEEDDNEEDDEDFVDETIIERILALSEMFPESFLSASSKAAENSVYAAKKTYELSRIIFWIVFSSCSVSFLPAIIESERAAAVESEKRQQRQILFGPGSASGGLEGPPIVGRS